MSGRGFHTAGILAGGSICAALTFTGGSEAGSVKVTVDNCVQATALLAGSTGSSNETQFQAIIDHLKKEDRRWEVVPSAERMIAKKIALKRSGVKSPKQGQPDTMLVAECGHGGTCNTVANEVLKLFPQMSPAPEVHCGDTSNILDSGSPVP